MEQVTTRFGARISKIMSAGVIAIALAGFTGYATADSQSEYNDAVYFMNKAYAVLGKADTKFDAGNSKSATRHFNKAMKDFDKAIEHLAKSELPPEDKPAIDAMTKGLKMLEKSSKALEKNDIVTAQNDYDAAQNYFAEAEYLLQ